MNGQNNNVALVSTIKDFGDAWTQKMTEIWRDRMDLLGVYDTGALRSSLVDGNFSMTGDASATASFQFLEYGIYVDAGTGNGYKRGNGGELYFLENAYRFEHKLGKPRQKKPWFSKSWAISRRVMIEKMSDIIGDTFVGAFDNLD